MKKIILLFFISPLCFTAQVIVGDSLATDIIYKNIKDTTISIVPQGTNFFNLDLDADNVYDMKFRISQSYSPGHVWENQSVRSLNGFEFVTLSTPIGYLDTLGLASNINSTLNWYPTADSVILFNYFYTGGNTTISGIYMRQNNFLGFRKINLNDTVYGWMLLDAGLNSGIKIRSWAYQNKLTGIDDAVKKNITFIYPNPANNALHIRDEEQKFQNSNIVISNYLGQTIIQQTFSKTIDVSKLPTGIYVLIIISSNKQKYFNKFIKE